MMALTPVCALVLASLISGLQLAGLKSGVAHVWRSELLLAALMAPLASMPFAWLSASTCPRSLFWVACAVSPRASLPGISPAMSLGAASLLALSLMVLLMVLWAGTQSALRSVALSKRMAATARPASEQLQTLVGQISRRFALPAPRLVILPTSEPLAFTYGAWRPAIALSTWMVEELDAEELEAVLAHELGHVARRDYVVMLLATTLRNAFFYLPASQTAHQLLCQEKERASDTLAITRGAQPLALASALTKVWRTAAQVRAGAQALTGQGEAVGDRVVRLVEADEALLRAPSIAGSAPSSSKPRFSFSALATLVMANCALITLLLGAMGCLRGI